MINLNKKTRQNEKIKKSRISRAILFSVVAALLASALCGCSGKGWKGYEKEDLSEYISLGEYKGLSCKSVSAEVSEDEIVERMKNDALEHSYEAVVTDRSIAEGDTVLLSVSCVADGEQIPELSLSEKKLTAGQITKYEWDTEIASMMIGKMPGESFSYEMKFASDFILPILSDPRALMGKTAVFEISLAGIVQNEIPEIDGAFAESLGFSSLEQYREKVKGELEKKKTEEAQREQKNELWQKAVNGSAVKSLPESEVKKYYSEMKKTWEYYAEQYNYYSFEYFLQVAYNKSIESFEADAREYAEETVKQLLVLYSIAKAENIEVSGEEYEMFIETLLSSETDPDVHTEKDLERYYGEGTVRQTALWEKVTDLLLKEAVKEDA